MNPKKPGVWKIVAETDNLSYFLGHADVCIREATHQLDKALTIGGGSKEEMDKKILKAIRLLVLGRIKLGSL